MEEQNSNQQEKQQIVLVTGATGFVAGHVINVLLQFGFKVRGTVRSLENKQRYKSVYEICPSKNDNIELVEANLLNPDCWDSVMKGCDYVIHCASPFPSTVPKQEDEIIKPAVEGTKAVMTAAIQNQIKKIVITSSIASVFTGCKHNFFSEKDWSNLDNSPAYEKSKHLAEKMAWEIYNQNKGKIKLTTICPGFIQGPNFHNNDFTSGDFVIRAMKNDILGIPKISLGMVDVRDVALAHVKAIQLEDKTDGNRYILNEGSYWMEDSINILRDEFGPKGYKLPSMTVNKLSFMCYACCDKSAALLKPFYGRMILFDNTKSKEDLGIIYINNRKTLIDMANDLIEKGRIPKKKTKKSKK